VGINDRLNQLGLIEATEGKQDLTFVSVPGNYPYLIEGLRLQMYLHDNHLTEDIFDHQHQDLWFKLHDQNLWSQSEGAEAAQLWGHASPMLRATSQVTGCILADTPPNDWPEMFAKKYMDNKIAFGVLQDPYTRIVDFFKSHPRVFATETETCDVDTAVEKSLGRWTSGDKYELNCGLIPQSEYFDGKYGAKLAIDGRNLTGSLHETMQKHGFDFNKNGFADLMARRQKIGGKCQHLWAGSLSNYSKKLVKVVYENDFKLLCSKFNYCDNDETPCLDKLSGACQVK